MNVNRGMLLAVLAVAACQQPSPTLSAEEAARVTDSVRQTLNRYYADIRTQGLNAEFQYLDSSTDFFWVPPGYTGPISYDSVATVLRRTAPRYTLIDNVWDTLSIRPMTEELASYTGRLTSTMTDTAGSTSQFKLVETGMVIKRTAGWKLLGGQTSIVH